MFEDVGLHPTLLAPAASQNGRIRGCPQGPDGRGQNKKHSPIGGVTFTSKASRLQVAHSLTTAYAPQIQSLAKGLPMSSIPANRPPAPTPAPGGTAQPAPVAPKGGAPGTSPTDDKFDPASPSATSQIAVNQEILPDNAGEQKASRHGKAKHAPGAPDASDPNDPSDPSNTAALPKTP